MNSLRRLLLRSRRGVKPQRDLDSGPEQRDSPYLPRLGSFLVGVVLLAAALLIIEDPLVAWLALGATGVIVLITSD